MEDSQEIADILLMRLFNMWARGFRPATGDMVMNRKGEEVPSAEDESKFQGGTHAEPGQREQVRVLTQNATRWITAFYDRVSCSFWIYTKGIGFSELVWPVISWTQMPPKGFAHLFTDPVVPQ